jgi:hypothetical protein
VKACDQQTKPTVTIVHTITMLPRWHFRLILMLVGIDFGFLLDRRTEKRHYKNCMFDDMELIFGLKHQRLLQAQILCYFLLLF